MLSSRVNSLLLCVSQTRSFGSIPVPVGPRAPDNVYRRPNVPMPSAPLREDDELTWFDGQAPEPAFDRHTHIKRSDALKQCLLMLTIVLGGVTLVVSIVDPPGKRGVAPQEFPFDGLHQELGGDYSRRARQQQQ